MTTRDRDSSSSFSSSSSGLATLRRVIAQWRRRAESQGAIYASGITDCLNAIEGLLPDLAAQIEGLEKERDSARNDTAILQRLYDGVRACEDALYGIKDRPVVAETRQIVYWLNACREKAEAELLALTRERERLRAYVQHGDGCSAWPQFTSHFQQATKVGECTCGLAAVLRDTTGAP